MKVGEKFKMDNKILIHAGIKGMRWGVRRYQNADGSLTDAGRKRYNKKAQSEDHIRAKALKKKKLSQLSNEELRELNTRMQLETQYKDLKKKDISAGKKFVRDVAYESAKKTASKYASRGAEVLLKKGAEATVKGAEAAVKGAYRVAAQTG